jgi:hypothetical protein
LEIWLMTGGVGDHGARRGGAVVERADLHLNAVLLEEALLLGDVDDHHGEDRRDAGDGGDQLLPLRQRRSGRCREQHAQQARARQQGRETTHHSKTSLIFRCRL